MAPVNVRFESGDRFEFNWNRHGETLLVPFEVAPGVVIPPGPYDFTAGAWKRKPASIVLCSLELQRGSEPSTTVI